MSQSPTGRFQAQPVGLVRDYVYQQLLDAMINGRLKPGEWIRERDVAGELGVSTTPVKEAVLRLHHEGLLRTEPRRGAYVSEAVSTSIEEIITIRARLEGLAAGLAAQKLTDEQRSQLEAVAAAIGPASSDQDAHLIEANTRFHDVIREISGNLFVQRFVEVLLPFDASVRRRALSFPDESERGYREHLEIRDAILAGDAERASAVAEAHIMRTFAFVADHMGTDRGDGE